MSRPIGNMFIIGFDYEYYKIAKQLRELGITPTGNKEQDKAKLRAEKTKLIQAIKVKAKQKDEKESDFKKTLKNIENTKTERHQIELDMLGAKTAGELNKIYFNL